MIIVQYSKRGEGVVAAPMTRSIRCFSLFSGVLAVSSLLGDPVGPPPKKTIEPLPANSRTYTVEKPGITVTVRVPAEPVVRSKMTLEILIKNTGTERILVMTFACLPDCVISIVNDQGESCGLTPFGGDTVGSDFPQSSQSCGMRIPPSETKKWTLGLDQYFYLKPNQYFLTLNLNYVPAGSKKGSVVNVDKVAFHIRD
jgi:hypothetical protein